MLHTTHRALKTVLTILLVITLLFGSFSMTVAPVLALPQADVTPLADLYQNENEKANDQLKTLVEAGLVGDDGKMIDLDVRQNGEQVDLMSIALHIASGGETGALTVNGTPVTAEQVVKLEIMREELALASLLNEDVEITSEHVSYLQSLLNDIAEGKTQFGENAFADLRSAPTEPLSEGAVEGGLPATESAIKGDLTISGDKFIAPFVGDGTYAGNYGFDLINSGNTTFYTDDRYDGAMTSASTTKPVVTVTMSDSFNTPSSAFSGTLTFSLSAATDVPVSLDYRFGGVLSSEHKGSVEWAAGESGDKTVNVSLGTPNFKGQAFAVLNCANIKNATFEGGKKAYSRSFALSKSDSARDRYADHQYDATFFTSGDTTLSTRWRTRASHGTDYGQTFSSDISDRYINQPEYIYEGVVDWFRNDGSVYGFTVDIGDENGVIPSNVIGFIVEFYSPSVAAGNKDKADYFSKYDHKYSKTNSWSSSNGRFYFNKYDLAAITWLSNKFTADGKVGFRVRIVCNSQNVVPLKEVSVRYYEVPSSVKATVSVASGVYTVGEAIPVNVNFDYPVVADKNTKIKINGTWYALTSAGDNTLDCKTLSVGYTVKDNDPSTFSVSEVSGLKNCEGNSIFVTEYNNTTVGPQTGVYISSGYKMNTIDFANAKWGVDDATKHQTFSAIIPIKTGGDVQWITGEATDCTENGQGIMMALPTFGAVELKYYLRGAYFSYDEGLTRYPVYVATSGSAETPVALVTRYMVPQNLASFVRRDTVTLYMPDFVVPETTCYLPDWSESLVDEGGYHYFLCGTDTTGEGSTFSFTPNADYTAPDASDASYNYYIKDVACFFPGSYVTRTQHYEAAEEGFIRLDNGTYVVLRDPEHPERQYDVEAVLSEELYQAAIKGYLREEGGGYLMSYQFSDRIDFTFDDPSELEWLCDNENKLQIATEEGSAQAELVVLGATNTPVKIGIRALNGAKTGESNYLTFEMDFVGFAIAEGKEPFLSIPSMSQSRTTLTNTATDVFFSTNLTARNAISGHRSTEYTLDLYRLSVEGEELAEGAAPVWTGTQTGTSSQPAGHITIPAEQLTEKGFYLAIVSATYYGGEAGGKAGETVLSATARLTVKEGPAKVTLDKLDRYAAMDDAIPAITYTVSSQTATVMYTVQRSGETVGEKQIAEGNVIPFAPSAPTGLKDVYVITVYARNDADEAWSVDSLALTVYNHDALDIIVKDVARGEIGGTTDGTGTPADGTTITMSNAERVVEYLNESGYQLTIGDFNAMRTDISLQRIVSVNYGSGLWGALSDKMQWSSSDPDALGINYAEAGFYADINVYSYTSYSPYTDFLIVGKEEADKVTVTATHAATGMQASFDVKVDTLKDQLYLFQFYPKTTTTVSYTNNNGVKRVVQTDAEGRLAVYEPDGIKGAVAGYANVDGEVYVGSFMNGDLLTGEADVATLQLYPCNNIRLRSVSGAQLTFIGTDNTPYNGQVILRGGVYKNNIYCPEATIRIDKSASVGFDGREDIVATVTDGKLNVWFDAMQFRNEQFPEEFRVGDTLSYVFEYRFAESYQPGYVILNTIRDEGGGAKATDSLVRLKPLRGAPTSPQIIAQTLQQYHGEEHTPNAYTRNVVDFNENIGISKEFSMARLYTDIALLGETLELDTDGNRVYAGSNVLDFAICKADGEVLQGQSGGKEAADRIFDLTQLNDTQFFIFPFSAVPFLRSTYLMDADNLAANGITSYAKTAIGLKGTFKRGETVVRVETLPFGVANLVDLPDVKDDSAGIAQEIKGNLEQSLNLGEAFNGVNTDEFVRKGLVFLGGMQTGGSKYAPHLVILPTANPEVFRIIAFIGYNKRSDDDNEGFSVNYDPDQLSEDFDKFKKALDEMGEDKKDNNDASGEGSLDFNFYGAIQLQTEWNASKNTWDISFTGGNVGGNIEGKYEWSYQMMCGPYPFLFTLELGFHVDAELAFANKDGARAMLLDAAFGISIEAFAGLGFDLSLVSFQLGIFGMIKADFNFLWMSDGNKTGSQLSIKGEIGIRMKIKLLFVSYSQTFCSIPFNILTQKYGQYDNIRTQWEQLGYAELSGTTRRGRKYTLLAFPDGTAMAMVDGGAELENRDYLLLNERFWYGGGLLRRSAGTVTTIQENAYPYSNPVFTQDGGMFLYLSDNDVSTSAQSSVSYATLAGGGYDNKGKVDPDDELASDTSLSVSGYGDNVFAAWIRQIESPEKEAKAGVTNDDLGMMLNASEIYGAIYNGTSWTTVRLTDNTNADLSPVVASSGSRAIVAWRSLDASSMPQDGVTDLSSLFDVENNVCYRIYSEGHWSDAVIAYNGSQGTVNALDVAMLADGTALISYTVRTGENETSTETFYTVIGSDGAPLTTARLTNDDASDVNAQVIAVHDGFLVGWYSEHDAGIMSEQTIKAHDIRLAYVYPNGSVDSSFVESVGGDVNSSYTSDFRFASPAGLDDIRNVSIVWSHKVESDDKEDDGKYEISAMRLYRLGEQMGVTAPITIVQTDKNHTIDHFDVFVDDGGKVSAVFVDSDYSDVNNVSYFDTIDLSGNNVYSASTATKILTAEPVCSIKLASAFYAGVAIEAEAQTNLRELVPGLDLPVQFVVRNTGTEEIDEIALSGGGIDTSFTGLNLFPGQSVTLNADYTVPESDIRDVTFTLTPLGVEPVETTLVLNRPDVGISSMTVVREGNMERDIQLVLNNISGIPLANSGKTVKLAFYQDASRQYKIGDEITIDPSLYADIDQGVATYTKTFKLSELMNASSNATRVYAYVWVEDSQELYPYDNTQSVMIKRLSLKSGGEAFTIDQALQDNGDGSYTVHIDLRNNTSNTQNVLYTVNLYGEDGSLVGKKRLSDQALTLNGEETRSLTVTFAQEELSATPVSVDYSKVSIVWLQYDALEYVAADYIYQVGGKYYMVTDESGRLTAIPSAICSYNANYHLNGWYTGMDGGGEFVTTDTVFTSDTTIYANATFHFHKYTYKVVGNSIVATCSEDGHNSKAPNTITLQAPTLKHEGSEGNANAVIIGRIDEVTTPAIVYKQGNTVLSSAPTTRGNYTVSITVGGKTLSIAYTITAPLASVAEAPEAGVFVEDGTVKELLTQGVAQNGAMRYALGTDRKTVPTDWSDQVPTASQAGRYYVWYKVAALNSDYVDSYPVGLSAYIYSSNNEDSIKYVSYDQVDGNVVKEIKEVPSGYVTLSQDNALTNWNNNWYVVKEDLTLNGNVNVNGNVNLLLCDGATLTINGKLTVNNNANFDVYAQAAEAGALTILGSTDRGAVVLGEFRIRGGMISIAGKEYYKYTAEELAALQEEDPTVQNEKYNQLALEVGRSNKGENNLSPNGAFHYNSLFAVYYGEVTVTDTQLNDNGEFRPFGGEIDLGALTLKGRESRVIAFGGTVRANSVTVGGSHCIFSVYGGDFTVVNSLSSTSYDGGYTVGWLNLNVYDGVLRVNNGINLENNFYQNIVNVYGGTLNVSSGWQAIHGAYDHKIRLNVYGGTLNAIGGERAVQNCDVNVLAGTARLESTSRALDGEYLVSKTARYYNGSEQFPENTTSNLVSDLDWLRSNANRYLTVIGAGTAVGVEYVGFDSPIDSKGIVKKAYDYTEINGNNKPTEWYGYGWYVVTEDVVYDQTVFVNGDVHLILADGVTLTANKGIRLNSGNGWSTPDASLSIYGQQECTGAIKARGADGCAAIGYSCSSDTYAYERYEFGKALYVHGGRLDLEGESSSDSDCTAAIVAQTVMIYDGLVAARYGQYTVGPVQVYANPNDSSQVPVLALGKGVKLYYDDGTINYGSPRPHSSIGEIAFNAMASFKGVSVHMHAFTYEIIDGTFVATCQLDGCNLPDNKHYWTPTMESCDYTGEPYAFSTEGWLGGGLNIIYCISRTEGAADYIDWVGGYPGQPPVNAGYYYVEVGIKDTWLDNVVLPFTIRPHELSIEWSSDSFVYDGNVHCPTATVSGLFGEDTVELTVEGGQTNAGTHTAIAHIANVGSNYSLPQDNSFEYVIAPKPVTATIVPKTSVYGETPLALEATIPEGSLVGDDADVYSLSSVVSKTSAVGSYDIMGETTNGNYLVTFVGGEGAYTVTKKALTVTANPNTIIYGDAPANADVSFDGFVNDETRDDLGGELAFAYTYEQFGHVSDEAHEYIITPSGYTSDNYEITFVTGVLTVSPKEITVTVVPKTSVYGDKQVALEATTEDGAIVNGDEGVYHLSCTVNELSAVGSYDIVGSDLSDNYAITFVGEKDAYTVTKKALTVTANPNTIIYGDAPANADVTVEGFVNDETRDDLGGELAFAYTYEQFGHVSDETHEYIITPSGYTSGNYEITFVTGVLTVLPKEITVTILPKTSVYGDKQVALEATTENGAIVNGDEGVYHLSCTVNELSAVGSYDIAGSDLSDNYAITFVGEQDAYTVTRKALIVTANPHTIIYGDLPANADVSFDGFVNDETRNDLGGELAFAYTYEQFGHVSDEAHEYIITPSGYTSGNYEITFVTSVLTVLPKEITVTVVPKTSVYGDKQVALEATTEDGAIVNGDEGVYRLVCVANQLSDVGSYDIVGSDLSDNYAITFVGEQDAYTITKKALIVTANSNTITYGDMPEDADVSFEGFVNGQTRTALSGELEFAYNYEQFDDVGGYAIIPSGYTSGNYEITFVTGVLTVLPKEITVTVVPKTSVYGEPPVALEATTEEGAVVNGDTDLYSLACEVNGTSVVGLYDIVGSDLSDNYAITFAGEKDAYSVTKRALVATAQDETIKYEEDLPVFRFELSEPVADSVLAELKSKTAFVCDGNPLIPGKYAIVLTFADGYTSETVLHDYAVTLEGADLYILAKELGSVDADLDVEIALGGTDEAFDYGISVEIGMVETASQESSLDYGAIQKQYVDRRSEISKVYSIKLYRTEVVNGVETITEIQPSDIKEGLTVFVKMEIPDYLAGRNFRILHIHSADDIEYVPEENVEIKDGYVIVKVDRFSEFAFVHLKANEEMFHDGFCLGWLLFIFNCLLAAFYFVFILLKRKKPLGLVGLIAACVVLAYGIIAISLHLCVITIVSFVVAVVLFAAWLTLYLFDKNKPDENDKDKKTETSAEEEIEPAAQEQVQDELPKQPAETPTEDVSSSDDEEDGGVVVDAKGNYFNIRYNKSFSAKLIQSSDETKGYYGELKNEVLSYNKTKSRISWSYDSINSGRAPVVKFGIRGKTLCVYFPLNAEELDDKYKVETVESAKYEAVPCMYRIKNERRLRYAKELIAKVCESLGLNKGDDQHEDYFLPYEATEALIAKGLIKELKTQATATQIERAKAEGTIRAEEPMNEVELPVNDGDEEDGGVVVDAKGNYFNIRYNKSFTAKLIQSSDETKGYYGELKNEALSYNKTKSRISWSYDSINSGRAPVVKFGIRGKTLCVYFPLNAEELDDKYKVETVESAKYEAVPCMYRIKNERRLRYAKELIAKVCESLGLNKGDDQHEDYYLPYESTEALIAKGLIKELKTQATATQIERAKQEGTIRIVESVSVDEVNDLISNEVAAAAIVKGETHATGKKGIVNVDVLSANFNDGDIVDVQALKAKKLIPDSIGQVKVLARGNLDKALHVELQDYSLEAVKMILATGGTVKKA